MLAADLGDAVMIGDIVVNLDVRDGGTTTTDYAVSVASMLDAHVTGIAIAFEPNVPGASMGYLPVEILDEKRRDNRAAAQAAIDLFTAATTRAGVLSEPCVLSTTFDNAADEFSRIARRFDLAIVDQAKPDANTVAAMISESVLFKSGRPIIVVPYIQKSPFKLDRVMVCWDGSRPAARAIADALPFLERAGSVQVVIVTDQPDKPDEVEEVDIGEHLARHRIKVEVKRIKRGDIGVADALLSYAADSSADFVVMGGYGHSRLREFMLGGVTRSMLHSMTAPTLMSH
jgi:nucleotide-binding universal stress UspA family protein